MMIPTKFRFACGGLLFAFILSPQLAVAQKVLLPLPRLLSTMPMGGQAGTEVEVTITGE